MTERQAFKERSRKLHTAAFVVTLLGVIARDVVVESGRPSFDGVLAGLMMATLSTLPPFFWIRSIASRYQESNRIQRLLDLTLRWSVAYTAVWLVCVMGRLTFWPLVLFAYVGAVTRATRLASSHLQPVFDFPFYWGVGDTPSTHFAGSRSAVAIAIRGLVAVALISGILALVLRFAGEGAQGVELSPEGVAFPTLIVCLGYFVLYTNLTLQRLELLAKEIVA